MEEGREGRREKEKLSGVLYESTNPVMRTLMTSSKHTSLPKTPPSNTIILEISKSSMWILGHKHSVHSKREPWRLEELLLFCKTLWLREHPRESNPSPLTSGTEIQTLSGKYMAYWMVDISEVPQWQNVLEICPLELDRDSPLEVPRKALHGKLALPDTLLKKYPSCWLLDTAEAGYWRSRKQVLEKPHPLQELSKEACWNQGEKCFLSLVSLQDPLPKNPYCQLAKEISQRPRSI